MATTAAEPTLRDYALDQMRDAINGGRAGLDPYDPSIFIYHAQRGEIIFTRLMIDVLGAVIASLAQPDGSTRYRAVLDERARADLGIDGAAAPVMDDEPLASRRADSLLTLIDEQQRLRNETFAAPPPVEPWRQAMETARHMAAVYHACGICGALPQTECECSDEARLASASPQPRFF